MIRLAIIAALIIAAAALTVGATVDPCEQAAKHCLPTKI